eukprot:332606-Amorphochlora_amoeboformis.AAC.1
MPAGPTSPPPGQNHTAKHVFVHPSSVSPSAKPCGSNLLPLLDLPLPFSSRGFAPLGGGEKARSSCAIFFNPARVGDLRDYSRFME